ncbi:MAG TPA: MFS transporter, partial [Trueperaceae bacterium]
MSADQRPGMRAFRLVWLGQLVSIFGTEMSAFALAIWAWQVTGEATALAMILAFTWVPLVIVSPLAGVLVDHWNRKRVLILADAGSACITLLLLAFYLGGALEVWHLFVAAALQGVFEAFQGPAFAASITLLVDKEHYSRAGGMMTLATSVSSMLAPVAAAALLAFVQLDAILLIDLVSFGLAVLTLAVTRIPQPTADPASLRRFRLFRDVSHGFRYILARPGLLGLQLVIL